MTERWQLAAACRGKDPAIFVPEKGDTHTQRIAIAICATCPVIDACREHAIEHRENGVWGGTTEDQRARMEPDGTIPPPRRLGRPKLADRILAELHAAPNAWRNQRDIARWLGLDPSTVGTTLRRLADRGQVTGDGDGNFRLTPKEHTA